MKNKLTLLLLSLTLIFLASCEQKRVATPMDLEHTYLIPKPLEIKATGSSFLLNETSSIYYNESYRSLKNVAFL